MVNKDKAVLKTTAKDAFCGCTLSKDATATVLPAIGGIAKRNIT